MYIIGPLQDLLSIYKIFFGNIYVIKDELDIFEKKFAKIKHIFIAGSGTLSPDPTWPKSFRVHNTAWGH
jgi:hypothetical protein